ncbi:hypothetical protein AC812_13150 [Bellilinea caldifistulae]|uniref:Uncharacterized protein n=1 Tax=Bellilinea caldifistulae TaxID=360411 RepID=A0A0P6XYS1_9CHLR|nr:hypothetical protein AC812_13150 [Bellilinea caldifistulae]
MQPTRNSNGTSSPSFLLGFAPGGGCLAAALLRTPVVSYTTFSPLLPETGSGLFLWPDPAGYPAPGVTRRRALWSADFPQQPKMTAAITRPARLI